MKNKYTIEGEIVKIHLKHKRLGEVHTIIDKESLNNLLKMNVSWHLIHGHYDKFYVKCTKYLGMIEGKPKYKTVYLHRILTECEDGEMHVDHINHDTLDNRISNLRIVTVQENSRNRKAGNENSSTNIRNVSYDKTGDQYLVQFQTIEGKNKTWRFKTLKEAKFFAETNRIKYYQR